MLVIPLTGKLSWRNPPWLTLLLILINGCVFFALQGEDDVRNERALTFYMESGLARMEVEAYRGHTGEFPPLPEGLAASELDAEDLLFARAMQMQRDAAFMRRLTAGEIIRPGDPAFDDWKRNRTEYDALTGAAVSVAYGYRPAVGAPITLFSYQFLHGGVGHLLGNMLFLWLFGSMLEMGLGRVQFLLIYLASGVAGAIVFGCFNPDETTQLVGASGAIAGLMGALTTTYGRSRVTFFFTTGFYFNSLRLPAIALLPFWLGKELLSELNAGDVSNVAFMAHAGGILVGAALGWAAGRLKLVGDAAAFAPSPKDTITPRLQKAIASMGALEFDAARVLLAEVLEAAPGHPEALGYLFNIEKHQPESAAFHKVATDYLDGLLGEKPNLEKAHDVYTEYVRLAKPPRLTPDLCLRLSMAFAETGHLRSAGQMVSAVVKKAPDLQGLPPALLKLAGAYQRAGERELALKCGRLLCRQFPHSPEARMADRVIGAT